MCPKLHSYSPIHLFGNTVCSLLRLAFFPVWSSLHCITLLTLAWGSAIRQLRRERYREGIDICHFQWPLLFWLVSLLIFCYWQFGCGAEALGQVCTLSYIWLYKSVWVTFELMAVSVCGSVIPYIIGTNYPHNDANIQNPKLFCSPWGNTK